FVDAYGIELEERQPEPHGDRFCECLLSVGIAGREELDRRDALELAGIPRRLCFAALEPADLHEESEQALVCDEDLARRRFVRVLIDRGSVRAVRTLRRGARAGWSLCHRRSGLGQDRSSANALRWTRDVRDGRRPRLSGRYIMNSFALP